LAIKIKVILYLPRTQSGLAHTIKCMLIGSIGGVFCRRPGKTRQAFAKESVNVGGTGSALLPTIY